MEADYFEDLNWFDYDQMAHLLRDGGLKWARDHCPVPHTRYGVGAHIVTRYSDIRKASRRPDVFSSRSPHIDPIPVPVPPFDLDPPLHRDFRSFLNPYFSHRFLERYRDDIEHIGNELIDGFINDGQVEFVSQFAIPFTSASLARVVFNDDNLPRLNDAVEAINRFSHGDPEGALKIAAIAREILAERKASPVRREDILQALVDVTVDGGRPLTEVEQLGVVTILLIGGLETTNEAIRSIGYYLATRDDIEDRMRNPAWVKTDMEEFLRITSTVGVTTREVLEDTELLGCPMKAGERVALYWLSGNRDEMVFDSPDKLIFERPKRSHLAFGDGIHRCLGQHFARLQISIAFNRLIARATNFGLVGRSHVREGGRPGRIAVEQLDLTFEKISGH